MNKKLTKTKNDKNSLRSLVCGGQCILSHVLSAVALLTTRSRIRKCNVTRMTTPIELQHPHDRVLARACDELRTMRCDSIRVQPKR